MPAFEIDHGAVRPLLVVVDKIIKTSLVRDDIRPERTRRLERPVLSRVNIRFGHIHGVALTPGPDATQAASVCSTAPDPIVGRRLIW